MAQDAKHGKAGALTAERITEWIEDRRAQVGMHLGTEPDLMVQFSVSRGVLREALRMLEARGVVETRRGRNGGVVVTRPSAAAVIGPAADLLRSRAIRPDQLLEARRVLDLASVPLVIDRMNNENRRLLSSYLDWEERVAELPPESLRVHPRVFQGFHTLLASLTANPCLELFSSVIESLVFELYLRHRAETRVHPESGSIHLRHRSIADALVARDLGRSVAELDELLMATRDLYAVVDHDSSWLGNQALDEAFHWMRASPR